MIAVDTNVLIRLLTGDDPVQYDHARKVFTHEEILILTTVMIETEWVLRYTYSFSPERIVDAFRRLFSLPNVHVSDYPMVEQALAWHEHGMDFSDALHLASSQGLERLLTFDRRFIQRAKDLCECRVELPHGSE